MQNKAKTASEIAAMRQGGKLLASVLDVLKKSVQPGMTTKDLSQIAKTELKGTGGTPTELGYLGFPDVLCVSVNDEVVHGIPSRDKVINDGDIVSMDFAVTYDGMITDSATSVIAGSPSVKSHQKLLRQTREALYAGISVVKHDIRIGDISSAIENVLKQGSYGIVRDLVGHGVGHELHESPDVPNYGRRGTGPRLVSGMTIAIEPMATLGDFRVYIDTDGWTIRTNDRSRAAHFEHTVLVTDEGSEVLTELKTV